MLTPRSLSILALTLLAIPAVTKAQQVSPGPTPAARWQQWLGRQTTLPVGAWAYNDALDDASLLERYTSCRFTVLPRTQARKSMDIPAGASAALDLTQPADRSLDAIHRLIKSGPTPSLVLLGQEVVPEHFKAAAEQSEAVSAGSGGAALPLNSLLPNWYCYFDRFNMTYEQYIEKFIAQAKPQVLMAAELPLMADGTDRTFYYDELDVLRRESLDHGIGFFGVVQAVGHGPRYRQPSASEMRWQVYSCLAYGAKGIWYYFFAGNGADDGLMTGLAWYPKQLGPASPPRGFGVDQTPAARQTLEAVRQINGELAVLSPTLLKLRSTGVFYNGFEPPTGVSLLRDSTASPFAGFAGDGCLIGFFTHADGDVYALIVNTRHGPDAQAASFDNTVSFTLKSPFSSAEVVGPAVGNPHALTAGRMGYTIKLPGGQGVLIHCH